MFTEIPADLQWLLPWEPVVEHREGLVRELKKELTAGHVLYGLEVAAIAETDADFRAEIPSFVAKVKEIFERWQLAAYLETARETEPFDPELFEPRDHPILGKEEIEFDAEEIEEMRKDDIRQCTRDLLLVERAREWLLEE